jgi:hypothetical protein
MFESTPLWTVVVVLSICICSGLPRERGGSIPPGGIAKHKAQWQLLFSSSVHFGALLGHLVESEETLSWTTVVPSVIATGSVC